MSALTPPSPLEDPSTIAIVAAVLAGAAAVGTLLVRTGTLSVWAVGGGFLLAWGVMYAHRLEPLGTVAGYLKARGGTVVLSAVGLLTVAVYALLSSLPLESWLFTNASFGLLLGVFAAILAGP